MEIRKYNAEIQNLVGKISKGRGKNPNSVIESSEKLLAYGMRLSDDALIGYAYFSMGETYYLLNDAPNFFSSMSACIKPMEHAKEWGYVAMAYNMLGIVSLNRGNAPFALDYYINAIEKCEEYKLPDIEWIIHMNLGSLYLNIEEYQKSLIHTENSYRYLSSHRNMDGYYDNLTAVYLSMARAYLKLNNTEKSLEITKKLRTRCMPKLQEDSKIVIYCILARLHDFLGEKEARDYWIDMVNNQASSRMPIMDVFDDFFDYLEMLLNAEKYDDFFKTYYILDDLTKKTTIKNLERKLLTLKIRYFRKTGQIDEYKISSVLYFELSEFMDRDNRIMVSNMVGMRTSYNELIQINKNVEQRNTFLQKRSETDPLTGMYNRFKLNEYCEEAFDRALINKTSIAIEILDIDFFKQYNDNYGHQAGDECIKYIAKDLLNMCKENGVFAARYGGDEFVVIYEGFEEEEVLNKAQNLRQKIYDGNMEHKFSLTDTRVTVSQGVCYGVPDEGQNVYGFLQNADKSLYEVKQKARNDIKLCRYTNY